jgi:predicted nuclease of predicted toxin-antitoxin system
LFIDENFPRRTVLALRELGHDAVTIAEAGQANAGMPDAEVLKLATGQQRAIVTLNRRDFIGLHMRDPNHAGIIVCSADNDHAALAARINQALHDIPDLTGKLIRVNR